MAGADACQPPRADRRSDRNWQDGDPAGDRRGDVGGRGPVLRRRREGRPCRACDAGVAKRKNPSGLRLPRSRDRTGELAIRCVPGAIVGSVRGAGSPGADHDKRDGAVAARPADELERSSGGGACDRVSRRGRTGAAANRPRRPSGDAGRLRRAGGRTDAQIRQCFQAFGRCNSALAAPVACAGCGTFLR